jgi:O-antigen/teichoic acid export membrane protein
MSRFEFADFSDTFQQFARDVSAYSVAGIIPAALSLVALTIFTRTFSAAAFGRYAIAVAIVSIASTFLFGWLDQSMLRFAPELEEEAVVGTTFAVLAGIMIVVIPVALGGYLLLGDALGPFEEFYLATLALALTQGMFQPILILFQATLNSPLVTLFKSLKAVLQLGFAVLLALLILNDIVGWIWGSAAALVFTIGVMVYSSETLRTRPRITRDVLARMTGYGLPMVGFILGDPLLNQADRLLIEFLRGSAAVGIYASNYTLVDRGLRLALVPVLSAARPIVFNAWTGDNEEEIRQLIRRFTRYYCLLAVPALIWTAALSRPLSTLFLGEQLHPGFIIIPIVGAGVVIWSLSNVGQLGLEVNEQTGLMSRGLLLAVVFNIVVDIPLIIVFGYVGAAVGTFLSYSVYLLFVWYSSRGRVSWQIPTRTVRNVTVAGLAMAAPPGILYASGEYTMLRAVAVATISPVFYAIVLYLIGEPRPGELKRIRSAFGVWSWE